MFFNSLFKIKFNILFFVHWMPAVIRHLRRFLFFRFLFKVKFGSLFVYFCRVFSLIPLFISLVVRKCPSQIKWFQFQKHKKEAAVGQALSVFQVLRFKIRDRVSNAIVFCQKVCLLAFKLSQSIFSIFSIVIFLFLTSCFFPSPVQEVEGGVNPPPIERFRPKQSDPVKQGECKEKGRSDCEREEDCDDICDDIFSSRRDKQECYEYSSEMVFEFESLIEATEDGDVDEIESIGSDVLECMLDIDENAFAKAIRKMSRREAQDFAVLIAENEDFADVLEEEDDEFNILRQLVNRLAGGSGLEEVLSQEIEDDKTLLWLFSENNEWAWDWLDNYVDEECDGRDTEDCPGGENIGAYCNALLESGFRKSDWEDFLSSADFFADVYEIEVENEDYEYEITDNHGRDYNGDFRDYCESKADNGSGDQNNDGNTPPPTTASGGICGRTAEVRSAILEELSQTDCAVVTDADLQKVGSLDLSSRGITALQDGDFSGLTSLQTLNLNKNQLNSLPANAFDGLTSLQTLNLSRNELASLPASVFNGLTNLEGLRLNNNQLNSLPANVFSGLTSLQTLILSNNELNNTLSSLPVGIFSSLTALRTLSLNNNQLNLLSVSLLYYLSNLQEVDFRNNQIRALPPGLFHSGLTNLTKVYLSGNQFPTAERNRLRTVLGNKIRGGF